jgi:hypothetical protein
MIEPLDKDIKEYLETWKAELMIMVKEERERREYDSLYKHQIQLDVIRDCLEVINDFEQNNIDKVIVEVTYSNKKRTVKKIVDIQLD